MKFGAIYIAHNPRDGVDIFKVGMTERSVAERMKELTGSTSNLGHYEAVASFVVRDIDSAEAACHKRLSQYRLQPNREFFQLELPRLVRIVHEVTSQFRAVDVVPDVFPSEPRSEESLSSKIRKARVDRSQTEANWDRAMAECLRTMGDWGEQIRTRLLNIQKDLVDEDLIRFEVPASYKRNQHGWYPFGTILVFSRITGEPVALPRSGLRGGIYGEPDLSNAIPGSLEVSDISVDKCKLVSWKEPDDGLIGKITLMGRISGDHEGVEKNTELPVCHLYVRAKHTVFDGYNEKMEERGLERDLRDPSEALDIVEAILVYNLSQHQSDVRHIDTSRRQKNRRGLGYRIIDKGRFETNIFD